MTMNEQWRLPAAAAAGVIMLSTPLPAGAQQRDQREGDPESDEAPESRSAGMELEFAAQPTPLFDFAVAASVADGRLQSTLESFDADGNSTGIIAGIEEGKRLPTTALFQATAAATWRWLMGRWVGYLTNPPRRVGIATRFDFQEPVVKPRVAPRAVRRPPDKARRRSILAIGDRGATPFRRDASPLECSGGFTTGSQDVRTRRWRSSRSSAGHRATRRSP